MASETVAKITRYVDPKEIMEYLKEIYDEKPTYGIGTNNYGKIEKLNNIKDVYDDSGVMIETSGYITFSTKSGSQRSIFYFHQNVNTKENMERYESLGLSELANAETTTLRLSADNEAVEILTGILKKYGGWLNEDDGTKNFYEIKGE